ncbi:hypothetical protein POM88_021679 [Heracleum sosnowskyi]|uniref:Uncharacterized protein n=1 Tax=Heracleum sosnowskyi TaxID=360622 RepID=A0AAD8MT25_9APIA|nr:hypothetical protein POM88_021679 [Heracleum sosnowskyi]
MGVNEGERELTIQEHYQQTLDSISLDPETFTHPVPAYQITAQQGNVEAERSLHLIHTTASMQRAKDALTNLSPGAAASGDFDLSDDEDSFGDNLRVATTSQTGTSMVPPRPSWLSQDGHGRINLDAAITRQYNEVSLAHESVSVENKPFYKAIMDSLEIKRLQMLQTRMKARDIKDSVENLKDATARRLDEKLPSLTVSKMNRFFSKEPEVSSSLKTLSSRVDKVEATLSQMQKEQEKQTHLLTQLLAAQVLPIISLDDNKNGEKSKELDIQITKVLIPAISLPKEPLAMGESGKNKLDGIDLIQQASLRLQLAKQIQDHWSSIDARVKKIAGTSKTNQPSTDQATSTEPSTNAMEEKAKDEAKEAGKQRKSVRQPKARAKRNLSFDKDDSQDTAQDSPTTIAHQIPVDLPLEGKLACDPAHPVNFHDQPIMPKEEPLEFDEAYFPKFLFEKDQSIKTKKRVVKAKPVFVRKPQPQKPPANPEDCMYIADIREESRLHLDIDNLVEVRDIAASQKLPERLVFIFKGGREQVWPLYRILGEDYQTLLLVFRCLKKDFGFTKTAKSEVVSKICQIKAIWNKPEALPRILRVP